jgi:PKD repeat protein
MRLAFLFLLTSFCVAAQDQGLRFIQNKGQWSNDIDFQAKVPGGHLGVSAKGFSIMLVDVDEMDHQHVGGHTGISESSGHADPVKGHYFQIHLLGSNLEAKAVANTPLDGYYNYFIGTDSCRWARRVKAFASVVYENVYDGIDFRVSSLDNNLKYDFIVRPGADPGQIRLQYRGVDNIEKVDGELKLLTSIGTLNELKPFTYQPDGDSRQPIASEYRLRYDVVSFGFPDDYDECRELIIDPLLIFSTYSGSTADNWGSTATPGEHGTLYSAGVTNQHLSGVFPATVGAFQTASHGNYDMGIIKFDSAGTKFLYATHLGGSGNDSPQSLVVDKNTEDLIVLGISSSPDFPTSGNASDKTFNGGTTIFNRVINTNDAWDIVITRFSRDGDVLVGSTFLGGSGNDGLNHPKQSGGPLVVNYGDEMRGDVITDDTGNVYITSVTGSADFPIVNGFDHSFNGGTTDGIVVKLTPDLSSITWSSYVGGAGFDAAYSIKFDNDLNIVVAGGTTSADFPTTEGAYQKNFNGVVDGWIARISADGSEILNATYTGTSSFDQIYFIDLNANGEVFCYGQTAGQMPVTQGVYHNVNTGQFLQKFSPDLGTMKFSTVFGSSSSTGLIIPNISPTAFLVNDCDNIYMAGWGGFVNYSSQTGFWQSDTNGMPITNDAYQKTTSGSDFYFIVLNGDATKLVYSTYLGGNYSKTHVDGGTSRFDKYGIVYHAVCSGCVFGNTLNRATSDFPTTPNAKSRLNLSQNCNNAAFKFDLSSLRAMFDTNNTALTMPGFNNVCYPEPIVFENFSTGGRTITWDFGDGTVVTQKDTDPRHVVHRYTEAGQYHVKLKITDLSTCSQTDSTVRVITYFKDNIAVGDDSPVCDGSSFQLTASGGVSYSWTSEDGSFTSSEQSPIVTPETATSYYVTIVDADGCSKTDTLHVTITPNVRAAFQTYNLDFTDPDYNNVCYPETLRFKNLSVDGESFVWDFDDGTIATRTKSDTVSIIHGFQQQGVYHVKLKALNPNTCNKADSVTKVISYFRDQIEVGDDGEICEGTTFRLTASGGSTYAWTAEDDPFVSNNASPLVRPARTTRYFVTVTDANGCIRKDTTQVTVIANIDLQWQHIFNPNCLERPSIQVENLTPPADDVTFYFDFGDGTISPERKVEHVYDRDGLYTVSLLASKKICSYEKSLQLPVYTLMVPNVFTPDGSPGLNDQFEIGFGPDAIPPYDVGLPVQLIVVDRWGKRVFESNDYRNDWRAPDLVGGVYFVLVRIGDLTCKNWLHVLK